MKHKEIKFEMDKYEKALYQEGHVKGYTKGFADGLKVGKLRGISDSIDCVGRINFIGKLTKKPIIKELMKLKEKK